MLHENRADDLIAQGHGEEDVQAAWELSPKYVGWFLKYRDEWNGGFDGDIEAADDIVRWATNTKADLFGFTWLKALEEAMRVAASKLTIGTPAYYFSNGWFVTLVPASEIGFEGVAMQNCLRYPEAFPFHGNIHTGTAVYSLRDPNNNPHVTMAIFGGGAGSEIVGKQNTRPKPKYADMVKEWIATDAYLRSIAPSAFR